MTSNESIHGITFIDYAATNAFLAQGKTIDELLPTLGVESPQWDEANTHWQNEMANDPEFKLSMLLGEVFQNPAQGKYAGASTQTTDDAVEKIPDMEAYTEIQAIMHSASKFGVDPQSLLAERGLTVMDYSQAGLRFGPEMHEKYADTTEAGTEYREWYSQMLKGYETKYDALFEAQAGGKLGDDIEF